MCGSLRNVWYIINCIYFITKHVSGRREFPLNHIWWKTNPLLTICKLDERKCFPWTSLFVLHDPHSLMVNTTKYFHTIVELLSLYLWVTMTIWMMGSPLYLRLSSSITTVHRNVYVFCNKSKLKTSLTYLSPKHIPQCSFPLQSCEER